MTTTSISTLTQLLRSIWRSARMPTIAGPAGPLANLPIVQAPIEPQRTPPAPQWHALPGQVVELGTTGFQITMNLGPATRQLPGLYTLTTPETDIAAWGPNLALVKRCGEQLAADRAEFTCTPKGWQP